MIEFTESRLTVRFEDENLNETNCFKVEDKLGSNWKLKDMDFFYSKQQWFYFVEVSEYQPKAYQRDITEWQGIIGEGNSIKDIKRHIIKQYKQEQLQEIIKKALDTLLLAFSHQWNFTIDNNFIHNQPQRVCLYFIYYVKDDLQGQQQFDDWKKNIETEINKYTTIMNDRLPFEFKLIDQQLAKEKLNVFLSLENG